MRIPDHLFSSFQPTGAESLTIRFLGTAGFIITTRDRRIVFDPYVSRPNRLEHRRRLKPNEGLVSTEIIDVSPLPITEVFVGHAHSDHILDAPFLCDETTARLVGSKSVCRTGRAAGLPEEKLVEITEDRKTIRCGDDIVVSAIESRHAEITSDQTKLKALNVLAKGAIGRPIFEPDEDGVLSGVPFPGETKPDLEWPSFVWELRCGQVYDWHMTVGDISIVHVDSAELIENQFSGMTADIVCLCAVGRENSEFDYTREVIEKLKPKYVIPCHWDCFFRPYTKRPRAWPGVGIAEWLQEIQQIGKDSGVEAHLMRFGSEFGI